MQEVDAGGGCSGWVQGLDAGGGCRRWMQEEDAGGGCRGVDAEGGCKMWMQGVDAGGGCRERMQWVDAGGWIQGVYRWIPPGWLRAWGTVGGKFDPKRFYFKTCRNALIFWGGITTKAVSGRSARKSVPSTPKTNPLCAAPCAPPMRGTRL